MATIIVDTIFENNCLIAAFLGWKQETDFAQVNYYQEWLDENQRLIPFGRTGGELKFQKDWNWLMLVLDKIETLDFSGRKPLSIIKTFPTSGITYHDCIIKVFTPYGKGFFYRKCCTGTDLYETKIHAVWFAVVEFINWYNKQNKI